MVSPRGLPEEVKNEIERRSLELLEHVADDIVVIGGWAARALGGERHVRHTHDIDGVATDEGLERAHEKMVGLGLTPTPAPWGHKYHRPIKFPKLEEPIKLEIQLSPPRIYDRDEIHFFEFDLSRVQTKRAYVANRKTELEITVPRVEYLVSNKLGLPALFKNKYDACVLLPGCDMEEVASVIEDTDAWGEFAVKRIARVMGDLRDRSMLWDEIRKTVDTKTVYENLGRLLEKLQKSRLARGREG